MKAYAEDSLGAYLNNRITRVYYSTPFDSIGKSPWEGYDVSNPNSTNQWLGADQSYIYVRANTYEGDVYTGSPIGRVPIGSYAVEIIRIEGDDISYGVGDGAGTAVVQYTSGGNVVCQLFDLRTMHTVYTDVELSLSTRTKIRQNDGYIWIDGNGVYQKLPNGWLMYPTSVYDKYDLSRIYGYAIRNTKVGREGKAIILFE